MPQNPPATADRVFSAPGFSWDSGDAYLFDIDNTLLRNRDRVHAEAFSSAVERVLGRPISLEGVAVHGSTDTGILQEACARVGIGAAELARRQPAILAAMIEDCRSRRAEMHPELLPGVTETLAHLKSRGAALGLATGNLEAIAWLKMEIAGLTGWFAFGGFSDRFPQRAALIADGVRQARALSPAGAQVWVVGDTPRDIAAARANHVPVLALATGNFSFEQLMEHAPEVCASSLPALLALNGAAA